MRRSRTKILLRRCRRHRSGRWGLKLPDAGDEADPVDQADSVDEIGASGSEDVSDEAVAG